MDIVLRTATEDDVDFLTDVVIRATRDQDRLPADFDDADYRAGFAEWTREQVRGELPGSITSVIEVAGQPIGRLRVVRSGRVVELAGIQLLPAHQSRGVGTNIVTSLIGEARRSGVPFALGVEKDNPRARAFYERMGLRVIGDDGDEHRMRLA